MSRVPEVSRSVSLVNGVFLGLSPLPVIVKMKVYRDSLLKMKCQPGGDSYWQGGQPKVFHLLINGIY